MVTQAENELMTRIDGDAPMGRLMRENYWIPFALSSRLVYRDGPMPVRLFGVNYVAFRAEDGRIGFLEELCPHRRASLTLARVEGNGVRCIYHGWKTDVSGRVVECPTQVARAEQVAAKIAVVHFPVHEKGGIAWVWLGGAKAPPFPGLPFGEESLYRYWCVSRVPCNWLQGIEGSIDSVHGAYLHQTLRGDVGNRWGQDRSVMNAGTHFTGFTRSLLEEDAVVQTSMGAIVDRSKENLSSSDTAVSHARRMLLDAITAAEKGGLPPGSALSATPVWLPHCVDAFVDDGQHWEDAAVDPVRS